MPWACATWTFDLLAALRRASIACCIAVVAAWIGVTLPARAEGNDYPTQRLIVKFRNDAAAPTRALPVHSRIALLAADGNVALYPLRPMALGAHVVALDRPVPLSEARAIARRLAAHPDVEYVVPDRRMRAHLVPNDPFLSSQTYLPNTPAAISAFAAWDITTGSQNTVVAVVDTGYRPHAGMTGRFLAGYTFISDPFVANDGDGRDPDATDPGDWVTEADIQGPLKGQGCTVESSSWHGTAVASVIAANSNDAAWSAGINWAAMVLPVRVLGKCGGSFSDIMDGVAWAAGLSVPGVPANPHPAQIINMSLGSADQGACTPEVQSVIDAALAQGITRAIIVSAGNDSDDVANHIPANCHGVLSVAATDIVGSRASYSNFGATTTISAPGGGETRAGDWIFVLSNHGTTVPTTDDSELAAGTSFSAPMVSGVISLMLAVAPNLTAAQVRAALTSSAKPFPFGSTCSTATCGAGIVNAQGAVQAALALGGGQNYSGLWWASPAGSESGWGINFAHQGDVIFVTWFTYDANGVAWWLTMSATKVADGVYSGTLYQTSGPPFNAVPFDPNQVTRTPVGSATLTFSGARSGTFAYAVNGVTQTKAIALQAFGPLPTCVWGAQPDLTKATNEQDLWWALGGTESGWGVNLTQQGTTIFATWFTYDANRNPLWYSVTATRTAPNTYVGTLYRTTGPAFSAVPFDPNQVHRTPVGTATFTFSDGNNATFAYQVNDGVNVATQTRAITRQVFAPPGTVCQ
jgi:serine protease